MIKRTRAWLRDQRNRAYVYRVLTGLGIAAVGYGLLTEQEAATWLGVASQVLNVAGNGLASANTTTKKEQQ